MEADARAERMFKCARIEGRQGESTIKQARNGDVFTELKGTMKARDEFKRFRKEENSRG